MKVLGLLTAAAVLLVLGCGESSRQAQLATVSKVRNILPHSIDVFRKIGAQPNDVPDAVLNVTKCVAVFPEKPTALVEGTLSCRESHDRWLAPRTATLARNREPLRPAGDLIVLVVGDAAARRVASVGELDINSSNSARGPTLHDTVTITDADLRHDVLLYQRMRGKVGGLFFAGQIHSVSGAQYGSDADSFRDAVTAYFNSITPVGIIVHHSATLRETHNVPNDVREVDRFHSERGFAVFCEGKQFHVAYHYLILRDGEVQAGRPERCEGAHSEGYNSYLGISLVGDFSSKDNPRGKKGPVRPNAQQLAALESLSRQLMAKYHIPLNRVLRHSDVARTECPGDRFPFRELLRKLQ
jgi:hypothetical protein